MKLIREYLKESKTLSEQEENDLIEMIYKVAYSKGDIFQKQTILLKTRKDYDTNNRIVNATNKALDYIYDLKYAFYQNNNNKDKVESFLDEALEIGEDEQAPYTLYCVYKDTEKAIVQQIKYSKDEILDDAQSLIDEDEFHTLSQVYVKNKSNKIEFIWEITKDAIFEEKLIQSDSQDAFNKNVETEIKAGKPKNQALAIAYSVRDKNRKK